MPPPPPPPPPPPMNFNKPIGTPKTAPTPGSKSLPKPAGGGGHTDMASAVKNAQLRRVDTKQRPEYKKDHPNSRPPPVSGGLYGAVMQSLSKRQAAMKPASDDDSESDHGNGWSDDETPTTTTANVKKNPATATVSAESSAKTPPAPKPVQGPAVPANKPTIAPKPSSGGSKFGTLPKQIPRKDSLPHDKPPQDVPVTPSPGPIEPPPTSKLAGRIAALNKAGGPGGALTSGSMPALNSGPQTPPVANNSTSGPFLNRSNSSGSSSLPKGPRIAPPPLMPKPTKNNENLGVSDKVKAAVAVSAVLGGGAVVAAATSSPEKQQIPVNTGSEKPEPAVTAAGGSTDGLKVSVVETAPSDSERDDDGAKMPPNRAGSVRLPHRENADLQAVNPPSQSAQSDELSEFKMKRRTIGGVPGLRKEIQSTNRPQSLSAAPTAASVSSDCLKSPGDTNLNRVSSSCALGRKESDTGSITSSIDSELGVVPPSLTGKRIQRRWRKATLMEERLQTPGPIKPTDLFPLSKKAQERLKLIQSAQAKAVSDAQRKWATVDKELIKNGEAEFGRLKKQLKKQAESKLEALKKGQAHRKKAAKKENTMLGGVTLEAQFAAEVAKCWEDMQPEQDRQMDDLEDRLLTQRAQKMAQMYTELQMHEQELLNKWLGVEKELVEGAGGDERERLLKAHGEEVKDMEKKLKKDKKSAEKELGGKIEYTNRCLQEMQKLKEKHERELLNVGDGHKSKTAQLAQEHEAKKEKIRAFYQAQIQAATALHTAEIRRNVSPQGSGSLVPATNPEPGVNRPGPSPLGAMQAPITAYS